MSEFAKNDRLKRIEWLLRELRYECERGCLERDIPDEQVDFGFIVGVSNVLRRNGVVRGEFRLRPTHIGNVLCAPGRDDGAVRFKVIDGGKS